MQQHFARPTGPGAGVIKYDVITALSLLALRDGPTLQMTVLRLIALITARYNWKRDHFSVPQADMARMWNVSERTVKREIKRMLSAGLVTCVRPGVRGRVGAYRLNYAHLSDCTRPLWADVGNDYDTRMQGMQGPSDAKVVKVDFAQRQPADKPLDLPFADGLWGRVLQRLAEADPANLRNWYMKLELQSSEPGRVVLTAPSAFVAQFVQTHLARALVTAFNQEMGQQTALEITC